jgi:Uma2 family endonuclease
MVGIPIGVGPGMVFTVPRPTDSPLRDESTEIGASYIVLQNVSWDTYQQLLSDLGDHRSVRLAYDRGRLDIKMPSKLHELINRLIERIVTALTEELGLNIVSLGSTRFEQDEETQGVEPDSCFYIQNADRVMPGDDQPPQDCPPDLVIEVDIKSSSRSRLPIYQEMAVPEIWCYKRRSLTIQHLKNGEYQTCDFSEIFPSLSAELLNEWLTKGLNSNNHNALIKEVRDWVNA